MSDGERTRLLRRSRSPPPDGKGLKWKGVVYEVKKKMTTLVKFDSALATRTHDSQAWEPCVVKEVHDAAYDVLFADNHEMRLPLDQVKPSGMKRILKGVSGSINNGRLCCIMGPSGAGKSSMLNVLAGRVSSGGGKHVSGDIMLDGKPLDPKTFRNQVAYVMQEDALFATQTPYEAFHFSASLRNPSLTMEEREDLVQQLLTKLRLQKCANTFVGSAMIAGLSGGEKKRTAIGIELISNPSYLFLDEPTSGLDSYAAWMVCDMLRKLANGEYDGQKRTVVATIHQPSSEVFELFDDVILLSQGRLVYNGPRESLNAHFSKAGYPVGPGHNPADHVMFAMQLEDVSGGSEPRASGSKFAELLNEEEDQENPAEQKKMLLADFWESEKGTGTPISVADDPERMLESSFTTEAAPTFKSARASFMTQFMTLGLREARNVYRDKGALIARFGATIFLNLIVGFVFKGVGRNDAGNWTTPMGINNHFGGIAQIAIGGMFGLAQPMLLSFPLERPVFLREYATGTYGTAPYFVSKLLVEVPMALLQSTVLFSIVYGLMGLNGNFAYLVLATSLLGMVAASTALLIGSVSTNAQMAIQLSPMLFVPQILFSGFFIPTSVIPSFMSWAQYLCALKYGVNLLVIAEFRDPPGNAAEVAVATRLIRDDPEALFPRNDIHIDDEWLYCGIMLAVFTFFRLVACTILAHKGRTMSV